MPPTPFDGGVSFRAWAVTAQDSGARATTNKSDRHHVVVIVVVIRSGEFGLDWDDEDEWTPNYDAGEEGGGGGEEEEEEKRKEVHLQICVCNHYNDAEGVVERIPSWYGGRSLND
jgi:hypothetical protein